MFRILGLSASICLTACDQSNSNNITPEAIQNNKLTGTWVYVEPDGFNKTFHLSGREDLIVKTNCNGDELNLINNQNNMLIEESEIEFWSIKDTESLTQGNLLASKLDDENNFSFGSMSISIGASDPAVLNTNIDTTSFCSEISKDIIDIYVKDRSDIEVKLSLTNSNLIGSNSVELGEMSTRFTWKDVASNTHIEWLESGTLNCSFDVDNNLNCTVDGTLMLSGSLSAEFTILEKHLSDDIKQLIP